MYDRQDYLTHTLLNDVEDRIVNLYDKFSDYVTETYTPKTWSLNEYVFINDIKHIEDGIEYIGSLLEYPAGWEQSRQWGSFGRISYIDVNRWLKNIDLLMNSELNPLLPNNALYPSETLVPSNNREE